VKNMSITCGDMKKLSILYPQDRKEKVKKKKILLKDINLQINLNSSCSIRERIHNEKIKEEELYLENG
jgi:hypothetical protein